MGSERAFRVCRVASVLFCSDLGVCVLCDVYRCAGLEVLRCRISCLTYRIPGFRVEDSLQKTCIFGAFVLRGTPNSEACRLQPLSQKLGFRVHPKP